jgi:hypothetical protein
MAAVQKFALISASDNNERLDWASEIWFGGKLLQFY